MKILWLFYEGVSADFWIFRRMKTAVGRTKIAITQELNKIKKSQIGTNDNQNLIAKFEREWILQRQRDGAKAADKYKRRNLKQRPKDFDFYKQSGVK